MNKKIKIDGIELCDICQEIKPYWAIWEEEGVYFLCQECEKNIYPYILKEKEND